MGDDPKGNGSGSLIGVVALVTPLIAALGALAVTGTVGRVQRNEPEAVAAALFLVLLAGILWLVGDELKSRALRFMACIAALVGFALGLCAAVGTANDEPRPRVEANVSADGKTLTAKVNASSMETEDRLSIVGLAFNRTEPKTTRVFYSAYEGPDADGNVEVSLTASVPRGEYTDVAVEAFTDVVSPGCDDLATRSAKSETAREEAGSGTGCVTVAIPTAPEAPPPAPKKKKKKTKGAK